MAMSSAKSLVSASIWGIVSKIISSAAKFITIPMLVAYYGKADYGLIALAFSLNAYLRLMDMGLNIGAIRFFSNWLANGQTEKIKSISQSSIVFYGVIGIINAILFVIMANNTEFFFNLKESQIEVYQVMLYILAASAIFSWTSNVVSQILSAYGQVGWLNKVTIISSVFDFVCAFLAIKLNLSLSYYFFFYTISTLIIIPLNILKLRKYLKDVLSYLLPIWNGKAFREILSYSLTLFVMGIFQFSADNLRPLLIGKLSSDGISALTDYRVIQTISSIVMMFGAVFTQVLLPHMSKLNPQNDKLKIEELVYNSTKYISIFISFMVFILIANAQTLLILYMGKDYIQLTVWLVIWLLTLLGMHSSPVSSLILSSGKTKPVAIMAAISCIISLSIVAFLAPKFSVGAAVIGYLIYNIMQNCFNYFYYVPYVLKLNGRKIFWKSFAPTVMIGLFSCGVVSIFNYLVHFKNSFSTFFIDSIIFTIVFILSIFLLIKKEEIIELKKIVFK